MPDAYIPILRNDQNEREVISNLRQQTFGGEYPAQQLALYPLVEITDENDLNTFWPYDRAGDEVLVELPQYLTEQENKYEDAVTELVNRHGSIPEFYRSEVSEEYIPVVSGPGEPVDYSEHLSMYRDLRADFDRLAIRLILRHPTEPLTDRQRETLAELADEVRESDIVLFDFGENSVADPILDDIRHLSGLFENSENAVLNAFDAYDDQPDNHSPRIADEIGAFAFGDFGIGHRFKPSGGFNPPSVSHRHYHPNHSTVAVFEGDDYEEAATELREWVDWDGTHCESCQLAANTNNYDPNTWSRIKMGHYFHSVLRNQI